MIASSITLKVMAGTALLGATAGVVGSFAVLRRRALVGNMISHAALPGIGIAFLLTGSRDLLGLSLGAMVTGLLGIGVMTFLCRWTRTKEDAAIGIVLSTFFGAGVVLLSYAQRHPNGNQAGLSTYLFGETVGISMADIGLLAAVAAGVLFVVVGLYKEFQLLSFDPGFAAAQGWPTMLLDLVMMGGLVVVTIVGLPICGVILMAALMIIPGATARFWTNRLGSLLFLAAIVGATAGAAGTLLASPLAAGLGGGNLPPGPLIVLSAASLFLFSLLFAPQHGILGRSIAEMRLRARIVREHLLRALYELSEPHLPERPWIEESKLLAMRAWNHWLVHSWLRKASHRGLVERAASGIRLTPSGLVEAAEVTKTHRLWELFLVQSANIAADHVDRDADDVEHLLPKPLLEELERELTETGKMPPVPESPHALEASSE